MTDDIIEDGSTISIEVPLRGVTLHLEASFADISKRLRYGDGWTCTVRFNGTFYQETGTTADVAKERLVATLQNSPQVQQWAAQEAADADAAHAEDQFKIPPE